VPNAARLSSALLQKDEKERPRIRSACAAEYHPPMLAPRLAAKLAPALAAAACALVLYWPALELGFVFDDTSLLTAAGEPVALGGALPYRPMRYWSYLVDWSLGGTPAVYHFHNVALHALVAALTALLARGLGAGAVAAFGGALVVALHPIAVEAAAYVAGRRDLLCVAFGLAALLAQLGGRTRVALALLVGSVAAKESGLVFAAPLAAAAVLQSPRGLASIGGVAIAAAAFTVAYGAIGPWIPAVDVAAWGRVLLHYATGLAGVRVLSPEYPALVAPAAATIASLAAGAALLAVVALAAAYLRGARLQRADLRSSHLQRSHLPSSHFPSSHGSRGSHGSHGSHGPHGPHARDAAGQRAFVLAWTSATLLALVLWGGVHEPGADRHAYLLLPALGVAVAIAISHVLEALPASNDRAPARFALAAVAVTLAAAASLAASAATRTQMQIWSSERALWSHAVAQGGASTRAYANLARAVAADGEYALARRHLAAALDEGGDDGLVYASRTALRCAEGRRALAQRDVRRAHRAGATALVGDIARDCGLSLRAGMHLKRRSFRAVEASGK
jgi:hypothetical protein